MRVRVQEIVDAVENHEHSTTLEPEHVKFKVSVGDKYEEIMSYDQIISKLEQELDGDIIWKFKRITAHEGPLMPNHRNYKGSSYNVMVEWENGEITREPLSNIAADDPVTCAIYARDNDLLELDGWKRFKRIAKRQKKLFRMANQAKLRSYNSAPKFKYGFEVPRDYKHAMWLDKRNGNTKWSGRNPAGDEPVRTTTLLSEMSARQSQMGTRKSASILCMMSSMMAAIRLV
jgi:hypothetical protein